jgi:rhomboid family GlyGly-CTERM serine protease
MTLAKRLAEGLAPRTAGRGGLPLVAGLAAICLLLMAASLNEALEFQRPAILAGAWWRCLTGHLCHYGYPHLILNLTGAWLLVVVFREVGWAVWVWVGLMAALAVAAGLLMEPDPLTSYRGLSGVLYGSAAAAGVVRGVGPRRRWLLLPALLGGVAAADAMAPGARMVAEGIPAHPAAHLYGLVGGVSAALVLRVGSAVGKRAAIRYPSAPRCARDPSWP